MKYPFRKLKTNRLSTKIIVMVVVVLILSNSVFCVVSIINSRVGIRKAIQQRMLDIANCASGSINGDVLASLTAEDAGTPKYQNIYDTLAIFRDNVELEYVYAIRDEGDGRFTFTVEGKQVQNLFSMTPHVFRIGKAGAERLAKTEVLTDTASCVLNVYRRS